MSRMDRRPDTTTEFDERYRLVEHAAMRRVELRTIGADYGATSYTTSAQADQMARLLRLQRDSVLLDVGSGAGWPGAYLAGSTGAQVVLTDIAWEGLRAARRRLRRDGVVGHVVAASGDELPFRDRTFDGVTSSDVFC